MGRFRASRVSPMSKKWIDILKQDVCAYCGIVREGAGRTIDHIHPRHLYESIPPEEMIGLKGGERVGRDHWTNLSPACERCNLDKGSAPLLTFLMARHRLDGMPRVEASKMLREELLEWTRTPLHIEKARMSVRLPPSEEALISDPLAGIRTPPSFLWDTARWTVCLPGL